MARSRAALIALALAGALVPGVAPAASQLAALDIGFTEFSPSTARDVNAAGQVFVEGQPVPAGSVPKRAIFLPPHPGGSALLLACYPSCGSGIFSVADRPAGITETGQVFGARHHVNPSFPSATYPTPASWSPPSYTVQDHPPGSGNLIGFVIHMNAGGASVGSVLVAALGPGVVVPFYWSSPAAAPVALANLGSSAGPLPVRIGDAGASVGDRLGAAPRAVYWSSPAAPAFTYLGEFPGGATSHARDLDALGRVVGSSDGGSGVQRAALWRPSGGAHAVVELPVPFPGGSCQEATAISESGGLIAGNCATAAGDRRGVIWRDDGASVSFEYELPPLAGHDDSSVYGLGGGRLAAGSSGDPPVAVLWSLPLAPAVPALSTGGLGFLLAALLAGFALARGRSGHLVRARAGQPGARGGLR